MPLANPKLSVRQASDDLRRRVTAELQSAALAFRACMAHAGHVTKDDPAARNLMRAAKRMQIVLAFSEDPDDAEALHRLLRCGTR